MEDWNRYFKSHILQRGHDYYINGAVLSLEKNDNGYIARIDGTEAYTVRIEIENGEIADMFCDCPYAADGNNCKHMAAVLYAIEDGQYDEGLQKGKSDEDSIRDDLEKILSELSAEELKEILINAGRDYPGLHDQILIKYGVLSWNIVNKIKNRIRRIGIENSDRRGFINYYNAYSYCAELQGVIDEYILPMIDRGAFSEALELTCCVFLEAGTRDMDDSDGGSDIIAESCYEAWKLILEKGGQKVEKNMLQWFKEHRQGAVFDHMEEYIESFLLHEITDEEFLNEMLTSIDNSIKKCEEDIENKPWYVEYELKELVKKRIEIMEKLKYTKNERDKFRSRYRYLFEIRLMEINDALNEENYDCAIKILQESKRIDADSREKLQRSSDMLIDVYEASGRTEELKKELVWNVFNCRQFTLTNILKLKDISSDKEWSKYSSRILKAKGFEYVLLDFLEHEKLYDRLLKEIRKQNYIGIVDQYEKTLKSVYPEETKNLYADFLDKEAERASDRKRYSLLVRYLKKLSNYPGGKQVSADISKNWRQKYKRRRAMMDELGKAGF